MLSTLLGCHEYTLNITDDTAAAKPAGDVTETLPGGSAPTTTAGSTAAGDTDTESTPPDTSGATDTGSEPTDTTTTNVTEDTGWPATTPDTTSDTDGSSTTDESGTPCSLGNNEACPGIDCLDILERGGARGDGKYWIDPSATGRPFEAYCSMTYGGWTLLISASAESPHWGNNSANWYIAGDQSAPDHLKDADHHGRAYAEQPTNDIRICLSDERKCYTFEHDKGISLHHFFAHDISHVEYSNNSHGWEDSGSAIAMKMWEDLIDSTWRQRCQWLGINYSSTGSAIGLLTDNGGGCQDVAEGYRYYSQGAIGIGLASCQDTNGCPAGGSLHAAGASMGVRGEAASGTFGPWFVFGMR